MVESPDIRWKQRFHSYQKAFGQLSRAVKLAKERDLSELERQGLIQAFDITHELAWKTMKDLLQDRGAVYLFGSKDATREAFAGGLLDDGEAWMDMIQSRNRTTHTYNVETATGIAEVIVACYFDQFQRFAARLSELEGPTT